MTQLDVTQLTSESLSSGSFPPGMASDFRLFFEPDVHATIQAHAGEDTSVEICGILVGRWEKDENGPFAVVSHRIRCDNASSKLAEVTFTHESWAQINQEMDTKYQDQRIIGWYHSHPDFGIFLSDRDVFIQENFFSNAGQVAFVVDPVRKLEGVFEWREGKPELMSQYWVGNTIHTKAASGTVTTAPKSSTVTPAAMDRPDGETSAGSRSDTRDRFVGRESSLSTVSTVLSWFCLFLLGYLLAGQKSSWEQNMLREGAVFHYGLWNLVRPDWEAEVHEAMLDLNSIESELKTLSDEHAVLAKEESAQVRRKWLAVRKKVSASRQRLDRIEKKYGISDAEKQILALIAARKVAELSKVNDPALPQVSPDIPPELLPGHGDSSADNSSTDNSSTDNSSTDNSSVRPESSESRSTNTGQSAPQPAGASSKSQSKRENRPPPAGPRLPGQSD